MNNQTFIYYIEAVIEWFEWKELSSQKFFFFLSSNFRGLWMSRVKHLFNDKCIIIFSITLDTNSRSQCNKCINMFSITLETNSRSQWNKCIKMFSITLDTNSRSQVLEYNTCFNENETTCLILIETRVVLLFCNCWTFGQLSSENCWPLASKAKQML